MLCFVLVYLDLFGDILYCLLWLWLTVLALLIVCFGLVDCDSLWWFYCLYLFGFAFLWGLFLMVELVVGCFDCGVCWFR